MDSKKKNRGTVFTPDEKEALRSLVETKISIVENKCTKADSNCVKDKAWSEILKNFNNLFPTKNRSLVEIKGAWKRMKVVAKEECGKFSTACRKTGGGSTNESTPSEISEKIQSMIPEQMAPMVKNRFDDDGTDDGSEATDEQMSVEGKASEKQVKKRKEVSSCMTEFEKALLSMRKAEHDIRMDILKNKQAYWTIKRRNAEMQSQQQDLSEIALNFCRVVNSRKSPYYRLFIA